MEPTAEQLIRDYLDRLSVAAQSRLRSDDRRAFLARTREFIERRSSALGTADPARVQEILAGLGEPAAAVELEDARLAAERSSRAAARSGKWRPRPRGGAAQEPTDRRSAPDAEVRPGSDAVSGPRPAPARSPRRTPRAAVDVSHLAGRELTGDIEKKVKANRPVTSRWRPGGPAKPPQTRPSRSPRPGPGGSPLPDQAAAGPSGSGTSSPSAGPNSGVSGPVGPEPSTLGAPQAGPSGPSAFDSAAPGVAAAGGAGTGGAAAGAARNGSAGNGSAGTGGAGTGGVPSGAARPEASGPEPVLPGQVPPPRTAPGTAPTAAMPADGVPAPGTRSTRAFTSRRWRAQRGQLAGVTRGAAGRAAGFAREHRAEATAIGLMAIAGLIYPFPIWALGSLIWLTGAAFAAAAKVWTAMEKWVGIVGPPTLVIAGTAVTLALGGSRTTMAAFVHEVLANSVYLIKIFALLGAGYLAWRARRGPSLPPWNRPHRGI